MATRKRSAIGIVGLGNMGSALAASLLERRHAVAVWNRTPARADAFAGREAAHVACSAAQVAARSDIVLACLADHGATMEVIATGDVAAALRGKLLLQTATVTSREARQLSAWAGDNAVDYLDCQILDYAGDVRNGAGTVVCSGPRHLFERHRAVLDTLAGKAVFVSETVGAAPALDKAVLAFGYGVYMAFLQGAAMCAAAGVPIDLFLDRELSYLRTGHLGADYERFARMIATGSYEAHPEAHLDVWAAAMTRVIGQCEETGVAADPLRAIGERIDAAIGMGHGRRDFAAVFEAMAAPRRD